MVSQLEKIELARLLLSTDDDSIIEKIKSLLTKQVDLWDKLPSEVKDDIELSLEQLEQGLGIPHQEVMKKYDKWLSK